jgi:hypothetical protein
VAPFNEIDPGFKWPSAVITHRDFGRWGQKSHWFSRCRGWTRAGPRPVSAPPSTGPYRLLVWFVSRDAQTTGAEAGGIPVRADVYNSGLENQTKFRYMRAVGSSTPCLQRFIEMSFSQEVIDVLELRLNQSWSGNCGRGSPWTPCNRSCRGS